MSEQAAAAVVEKIEDESEAGIELALQRLREQKADVIKSLEEALDRLYGVVRTARAEIAHLQELKQRVMKQN